ncbi:MAG: DUF21 domain-containing protein [Gammaproteobacteria bacterium]|nr:DUF21 domain-containing protein [Gammaproteobacteria bacterium]
MNEVSSGMLLVIILALLIMSAYFAATETAMMALNRYRLRHLVNEGHRGAGRAQRLLERPDRLLGVILVGNNLVNFIAAALFAVVATRFLGETAGVIAGPIILTLFVLIFVEVTPKTVAAQRPELVAFWASFILAPLLKIANPVVVSVNAVSNYLARPLIGPVTAESEHLSVAELKTVLAERAAIPPEHQEMVLRILELQEVTIDQIMVPLGDIEGIDISDDNAHIKETIQTSQHTRLPVFRDSMDEVLGVLHLRRFALFRDEFTKAELVGESDEPYFVPEATSLSTQLMNFRKEQRRLALVVDEYGDVHGLVTLDDILEEIVGQFTTDFAAEIGNIVPERDGSFVVDGKTLVRTVNRELGWDLPTAPSRTINGMILDHLELIPDANVGLQIGRYLIETQQITENGVRYARISVRP